MVSFFVRPPTLVSVISSCSIVILSKVILTTCNEYFVAFFMTLYINKKKTSLWLSTETLLLHSNSVIGDFSQVENSDKKLSGSKQLTGRNVSILGART